MSTPPPTPPPPLSSALSASASASSSSLLVSPFDVLPDATLYRIATFAAAPTYRCAVLVRVRRRCCCCCRSTSRDTGGVVRVVAGQKRSRCDSRIIPDEKHEDDEDDDDDDCGFWQMVLAEEYGVQRDNAAATKCGAATRSCRRLRRSMRQRVIEAHASVLQNTEFAFFHLAELTTRSTNSNPNNNKKKNNKKGILSKSKLMAIIDEFGPVLRLSGTLRSGGVFLVEVCRAKGVREPAILKCVEYLVIEQRCDPNDTTNESPRSRQTALVVAAARGLSTVVSFLLSVKADPTILCAGRFRLTYATTATVSGVNWTAYQFATAMRTAELTHGTTPTKQLKGLDRCIALLAKTAEEKAAAAAPPPPEKKP